MSRDTAFLGSQLWLAATALHYGPAWMLLMMLAVSSGAWLAAEYTAYLRRKLNRLRPTTEETE